MFGRTSLPITCLTLSRFTKSHNTQKKENNNQTCSRTRNSGRQGTKGHLEKTIFCLLIIENETFFPKVQLPRWVFLQSKAQFIPCFRPFNRIPHQPLRPMTRKGRNHEKNGLRINPIAIMWRKNILGRMNWTDGPVERASGATFTFLFDQNFF